MTRTGALRVRLTTYLPLTAGALLLGADALTCSCTLLPIPSVAGLPPNFQTVDPGAVYRSAQPTGEQLRAMAATYGIRTVLNLRGANPGKSWYEEEASMCAELGITLVDCAMSAQSLPPAEVVAAINQTFRTAEYPMLIHCQGGADRSGAAAAIYRILILGQDNASAAAAELSPATLHFAAAAPCMDKLVQIYQPTDEWLAQYAAAYDQLSCTGP